jgi:hypothetical protein
MTDKTDTDGEVVADVGRALSKAWPHYWFVRGMSWEQVNTAPFGDDDGGSGEHLFANALVDYGYHLLRVARRGLFDATDDLTATAATEVLMSLAEDYVVIGASGVSSEGRKYFELSRESAMPRSYADELVRSTGIADWCAAMGVALEDANGQAIHLGAEGIPPPTFDTPGLAGLLVRLRGLPPPSQFDQPDEWYEMVARRLPDAFAARNEISHAVSIGQLPVERRRSLNAAGLGWLHAALHARGQWARVAQRDPEADFTNDAAAITLFRLIAQDVVLLAEPSSQHWAKLPILTEEQFDGLAEQADVHAWIARHTPTAPHDG